MFELSYNVCYSYPDEEAGEVPLALVVRAPYSNLDERQVIDFIAAQVPLSPVGVDNGLINFELVWYSYPLNTQSYVLLIYYITQNKSSLNVVVHEDYISFLSTNEFTGGSIQENKACGIH